MLPPPPRATLFPYTTLFRSVLNVVAATLAGYGLTRFAFAGKKGFAFGTLFSYMFPPILMVIPLYILFSRSEEHTSELQSRRDLVCRLLLEKKKRSSGSTWTR